MKYKIINGDNSRAHTTNRFEDFQNEINKALDDGWKLYGDLNMDISSSSVTVFYQPMIKTEVKI